ncbi:MAG: hypothetical protein JO303_01240, partial [Caulobacteraceae bacterium]|nr:hypothetical protein [Caulobacteraceae bacterium]
MSRVAEAALSLSLALVLASAGGFAQSQPLGAPLPDAQSSPAQPAPLAPPRPPAQPRPGLSAQRPPPVPPASPGVPPIPAGVLENFVDGAVREAMQGQ